MLTLALVLANNTVAIYNAVDAHAQSIKAWVDVTSGSFSVADDGKLIEQPVLIVNAARTGATHRCSPRRYVQVTAYRVMAYTSTLESVSVRDTPFHYIALPREVDPEPRAVS